MDTTAIQQRFISIGAWAEVQVGTPSGSPLQIDIRRDHVGEHFAICFVPHEVLLDVIDTRPRDRHLLLLSRGKVDFEHFVCGHDERHWFAARIPDDAEGVNSVASALEALKPREVIEVQTGLAPEERNLRRNTAFLRQGEWFFLPTPHISLPARIRNNAQLIRGPGSKAHSAQFWFRLQAETRYECSRFPKGLNAEEHMRFVKGNPNAKRWKWRVIRGQERIFVKGWVRHVDHEEICLDVWHEVLLSREAQLSRQSIYWTD